jgi:hypothetical protein
MKLPRQWWVPVTAVVAGAVLAAGVNSMVGAPVVHLKSSRPETTTSVDGDATTTVPAYDTIAANETITTGASVPIDTNVTNAPKKSSGGGGGSSHTPVTAKPKPTPTTRPPRTTTTKPPKPPRKPHPNTSLPE